jgi:hypothetical protein
MEFKWHEFSVDVPRIKLFVNEKTMPTSDPIKIWKFIIETFGDYNAELVGYYFCQASLARHFLKEVENIDEEEELTSRGKHEIHINTNEKNVIVVKDFLKLIIVDTEVFITDNCTLTLHYDAKKKQEKAIWSYYL